MKKWFLALCLLLSFCLLGCIVTQQPVEQTQTTTPTDVPTEEPAETPASLDILIATPVSEPGATAVPTAEPTPEPTATPEPTPAPTPVPTREPKEGDVTDHFPNYDTGVDADYSYQSDELRIAITVVEDEEELQKYYVADIWIRNISAFRTGFGNGAFGTGTEDSEDFATREHAILAMTGSMNMGMVYHNGQRFKGFQSQDAHPGIAVIYTDGSMKVFLREKFSERKAKEYGTILHAWQFGPALVSDGEMTKDFPVRATRHPRCILGYYEPGHYCLVTVDGRSKTALGMTEREMAELMLELGCKEALNLDGGSSAMMVFMGEVINKPSLDNDGDGKSDRRLKDMLLFAEYDDQGDAPALEDVDMGKVKVP